MLSCPGGVLPSRGPYNVEAFLKAVAALILHDTQQFQHPSCILWRWREATALCCKWFRHGLATGERDESQRAESCSAQHISSKTCLPAKQHT